MNARNIITGLAIAAAVVGFTVAALFYVALVKQNRELVKMVDSYTS